MVVKINGKEKVCPEDTRIIVQISNTVIDIEATESGKALIDIYPFNSDKLCNYFIREAEK